MNDCHLPRAVSCRTRSQLDALTDSVLGAMLTECREWVACMETYRASLRTAPGCTEWHVHTKRDRADVAEAMGRLKAEIERRIDAPFHSMLFERQPEASELALA